MKFPFKTPVGAVKNNIRGISEEGVILFDYDVPSKSFLRNIKNPKQTKKLIEDILEPQMIKNIGSC